MDGASPSKPSSRSPRHSIGGSIEWIDHLQCRTADPVRGRGEKLLDVIGLARFDWPASGEYVSHHASDLLRMGPGIPLQPARIRIDVVDPVWMFQSSVHLVKPLPGAWPIGPLRHSA